MNVCSAVRSAAFCRDAVFSHAKDQMEVSDTLVHLGERQNKRYFTSQAVWKVEERLFAGVDVLMDRSSRPVSSRKVEKVISKDRGKGVGEKRSIAGETVISS